MTGVTSGAGIVYSSEAPGLTPGWWGSCCSMLSFLCSGF